MNTYSNIRKKIELLEERLGLSTNAIEQADLMNDLAGELFVYEIDKAQDYAHRAKKLSELHHYKKGLASALVKEALCCRIRSDFKKSIVLAKEALSIFESLDDLAGQADALNNLAFMEVNIEDYESALKNGLRALALAQEAEDKDLEAFASLVMGMVYEALGDYPAALEHHLKTLTVCRITGHKANEGAALINIGIVFRKIGELEKAKEHYESAYLIFKSLQIKLLEAAALYNIGTSYRDFAEYNKAYEFFNSSLRLQKKIGHVQGQGACYISIGYVLTKLKKFAQAEEHIRQSMEMARAFSRKSYECNSMLALGECYMEQHRHREAITILEEARSEADIYGAKDVRFKIMLALSSAYEMKGDFRKSLNFFKEGIAIRDELINEESSRKNKGLMVLHEMETAKREREIALIEKARAEQSERFKEQFLANMSHEIRTPLNAIVGLIDLITKTKLNPLQSKYLEAIGQSADNLLSIIQDILDFSKIESGQTELEEINFSIHETLDAIYNSLRYKAEEKNISLSYQKNSAIPANVCGDPLRLKQILLNLVGNAIKFTEAGSVTIEANVHQITTETIGIKFSVADTGIGIAEAKLGDIFKSFVQASASTTRKYGGTGLGLSIAKHLVELQNGSIEVFSHLGKGTIFSFTIPYQFAKEAPIPTEHEAYGENVLQKLDGCRVLVVEDNKFNQLVVVDSLQSSVPGVEIEVAENGKLAIDKLQTRTFDVMLLDLHMPEMDGYETVDYVRNKLTAPQKDVPIIALTANATQTEKEKCLKSGMNGYLSKPFRIDDLIVQIQQVMEKVKV